MRRPTDGDAAYQLRLALRALRVCHGHVCRARLDAVSEETKRDCQKLAVALLGVDSPNVELLRLIHDANAHVAELRKAKKRRVAA